MENTQPTADQLRIAELEQQLAGKTAQNISLEQQLAEKTAQNGSLEQLVADLTAQLEEQGKIIAEQHAQLNEKAESSSPAGVTITVNKKKYAVLAPSFSLDGQKYVAEDLVKDKELAKKLVELGAGILKEIV